MSHVHAHDHAGHDHAHHGDGHGHHHGAASERRILATFALISIFMVVEAVGGWWSGSLTLLADAGHMLTDAAALALAWFAARAMQRPSDAQRSYGHDRFSVLAALINGLALLAVTTWIAVEAVRRLMNPGHVMGGPMMAIAVAGLAVNAVAFFLLHGAERDNINVHAALLHVIGDILGSLAALVAAGVILTTDWTPADPILSAIAGVLILRNAVALVRRSWRVLMEATPEGMNVTEIGNALESVEGVADIHHLHVWSLMPGKPLITLHARVAMGYEPDAVLARIKTALSAQFKIDHSTIQMEGSCPDESQHRHDCDQGDRHGHSHAHSAVSQ